MTSKKILLITELISLFILIPVILTLNVHPILKIAPVLVGVIFCIYISLKQHLFSLKELLSIQPNKIWKPIIIQFGLFLIFSTLLMYFFNYENLFIVVRKNWVIWLGITFFYSIFSVYPREFLYRTFFFKRYSILFKKSFILIFVNASVFSMAHLAFNNLLVLALTFIGGILFAFTYHRSKSLLLTSIEHALYGSWLFTLGMGEILAFPVPN